MAESGVLKETKATYSRSQVSRVWGLPISANDVHDGDIVNIKGSVGRGSGRIYARNVKVVERNGRKYVQIGDTLEPIEMHRNSLTQ